MNILNLSALILNLNSATLVISTQLFIEPLGYFVIIVKWTLNIFSVSINIIDQLYFLCDPVKYACFKVLFSTSSSINVTCSALFLTYIRTLLFTIINAVCSTPTFWIFFFHLCFHVILSYFSIYLFGCVMCTCCTIVCCLHCILLDTCTQNYRYKTSFVDSAFDAMNAFWNSLHRMYSIHINVMY